MINEYGSLATTFSFITYDHTLFTINSINELICSDKSIAFIVFFDLIKKCFERLKKTMANRKPKAVTKLYSLRVMMTLKLIVSFLQLCKKNSKDFHIIGEISYPLIELILSLLDLYPHVKYYPLFIHYLKLLLDIQRNIGLKIPVNQFIFKMLNCTSIINRKSKIKITKGFDFEIKIKADPEALQSNNFWTEVCKELVNLLLRETRMAIDRGKQMIHLRLNIKLKDLEPLILIYKSNCLEIINQFLVDSKIILLYNLFEICNQIIFNRI